MGGSQLDNKSLQADMSVMLIDNCEIDNYVNRRILELYGLKNVVAFTTANSALLYLKNTNIKVDLILLEIYLPVIDGFEFIEIYNELKLGDLHGQIILLSATIDPNHRKLAEEMNIRFMEKPFAVSKITRL